MVAPFMIGCLVRCKHCVVIHTRLLVHCLHCCNRRNVGIISLRLIVAPPIGLLSKRLIPPPSFEAVRLKTCKERKSLCILKFVEIRAGKLFLRKYKLSFGVGKGWTVFVIGEIKF